MSFHTVLDRYRGFAFDDFFASVTKDRVFAALDRPTLSPEDYLALLSPTASELLEELAQRAHELTLQHFGRAIFIFTPLYLSNYCINACKYCSFAVQHRIKRRQLTEEGIRAEAERIAASGIRHLLVLTGEARRATPPDYLEHAMHVLGEHFSSLGIEIYPMTEDEYGRLIAAGVDSLTIYQEVYNEPVYAEMHAGGPKADYDFRLTAPERACRQNIRRVGVGALLGLHEPRRESFLAGLHAHYLQDRFPAVDVAMSFPRLRPFAGHFTPANPVNDRLLVQLITAFRIFLPRAGITVSTRERPSYRDHLVPLGVTRMSAGVSTAVGGHTENASTTQFDIADTRTVDELRHDLEALGYQPVMHDWNARYLAAV